MSDLVITAASVVADEDATVDFGSAAGETLAAGKVVYLSPTTGKWMLADDNSATAAARSPRGIALCGAALNQPVAVQKGGSLVLGAVLTPGVAYYLSDTPGGICPVGDLASGEFPTVVGVATSATELKLGFIEAGVAL